jgi:hypothetical protein
MTRLIQQAGPSLGSVLLLLLLRFAKAWPLPCCCCCCRCSGAAVMQATLDALPQQDLLSERIELIAGEWVCDTTTVAAAASAAAAVM